MMHIFDKIRYYYYNCSDIEKRLSKYHGYRPDSILKWKNQTNISWKTVIKLLRNIKIFDAREIRNIIKEVINQNNFLFNQENCYITSFGDTGKSGNIVLYEFTHAINKKNYKFIEPWEIPRLPEESLIVFVDDLIGTGKQSLKHINEKLNLTLNPSHKPYLLCLCATPEGIKKVTENTNFKILCGTTLETKSSQFYSNECKIFNENEKNNLIQMNKLLKNDRYFDFDKGLLISFYYSVPNSTMPIIWKDKYKYENTAGEECQWFALLPRQY